jgi:endonuclease/exonuclease/phosphatase family metal-dependent hydrolase
MRILFSNLGYARGIDGSLGHHVLRFPRNVYSSRTAQQKTLSRFKAMMLEHRPDLCCIVEIDRGSPHSSGLNQIECLTGPDYPFHDIADKYGEDSTLGRLPFHRGKSNGFLARRSLPFQRLYFKQGTKKLIYRLDLPGGTTLFFAHFSLNASVRAAQLTKMRQFADSVPGEAMILADFNIFEGFEELQPLIGDGALKVINREDEPTFRFHKRKLALDLCICSAPLATRTKTTILPQDFSDHAALLVEINDLSSTVIP